MLNSSTPSKMISMMQISTNTFCYFVFSSLMMIDKKKLITNWCILFLEFVLIWYDDDCFVINQLNFLFSIMRFNMRSVFYVWLIMNLELWIVVWFWCYYWFLNYLVYTSWSLNGWTLWSVGNYSELFKIPLARVLYKQRLRFLFRSDTSVIQ
jgi:hypothetical protein